MEASNGKNKNPKFKTFLFFLGMAILLWFLTKFSNNIASRVQIHLKYVNVPAQIMVAENNTSHLSLDISANGFQMLKYAVKSPEVAINVSQYYRQGLTSIEISETELSAIIKSELGAVSIEDLNAGHLKIYLDQTIQKKVPVVLNGQITFKDGYRAQEGVVLTPDSINIVGPSEIVNNYDSVLTKEFSKKNVHESFAQRLNILMPKKQNVVFESTEVGITVNVQEFSQKMVTVPVQLVNVPSGVEIKLIPETVELQFEVAVAQFNDIDATNFQVVCDYNDRITEGSFMIPKIIFRPKGVFRVEMKNKKIEYLIFK